MTYRVLGFLPGGELIERLSVSRSDSSALKLKLIPELGLISESVTIGADL